MTSIHRLRAIGQKRDSSASAAASATTAITHAVHRRRGGDGAEGATAGGAGAGVKSHHPVARIGVMVPEGASHPQAHRRERSNDAPAASGRYGAPPQGSRS